MPRTREVETLSSGQARNIALNVTSKRAGDVGDVLRHLVSVQLDAITVLAPAHRLTLAERLLDVRTGDVDSLLWQVDSAVAFEYPAHAAALVAVEDWPLWAFRRRRSRAHPQYPDPALRDNLLSRIGSEGPLPLRLLQDQVDTAAGWNWSPTKTAVQLLLWSGELACVRRDRAGNRLFQLPPAAIADQHLTDALTDQECLRTLVERAGHALGVATIDDLADYLRVTATSVKAVLPDTALIPVAVDGWAQPAWASEQALALTDTVAEGASFLGPFDNTIWYRKRVARVFDFEHRLEAYKPAAKRQHGYYVCPLRVGSDIVGRADLAYRDGTLTIVAASLNTPTESLAAGFSEACARLSALLGATDIAVHGEAVGSW
ncbi:DNA glycosylase AlkZ-like family protein [Saccharothrix yanglingensis]|uniref:Cytoplasmic protein n=1 Tax=Saccharothrix yanglingensis TaxID=659496 RepID=A0ABU0XAV6_9PSEU|nr:crosslink repair DNA glycosylase YcaQ family protein [Saccharothrix yanglingensis]MDQ2589182.1 cytoplasmic protein [Saccharothrix yanglingensis]